MEKTSRLKKAELASGLGALLLGIGLGALFPSIIGPFALTTALAGGLIHGWGMFEKHSIEKNQGTKALWWSELLYIICWIVLFLLVGLLAWRMLR